MSEWKETDYGKIPSNWEFMSAAEFCQKVTDGTHDSPKQQLEGNYLITSKHIRGRNIDFQNAYLISETDFQKINERSKVDQWDVIISMIGEYCGFAYIERNEDIKYAVKNVGIFKTANEDNAFWLYYYIQSKIGKTHLDNCKSGTSQPYITLGTLREYPILAPSSNSEKQAIASVLISLDDKMDLLHRQNATLEAMAGTLFRQWFVEEAKEDWETKQLQEVAHIGIGRTPPRKESQWFSTDSNDVKWISIKDMGSDGVFISNTSEFLTQEAIKAFNVPIIPKHTVVLSFKMTVGRVAITTDEMLSNEAIAHFKFNKNTPFSKEYLYLFLKTFKYDLLGSTSSIVTSINSTMIKEMEILIPDPHTMNAFKERTEPLFNKINQNQTQIRTLTTLRDTLLPKLMSGEVRVEM